MKNTYRGNLSGALMLLIVVSLAVAAPAFAEKTYTMKEGDTLWELSSKYYNDPTLYPVFLEVNNIDNPRMIPVGRVIIVPGFDDMKKVAQEVDPTKRKELIKKLARSNSSPGSIPETEVGKDEDGDEIKPADTKSISILNVLGGKKVSPKSVKNDTETTAPEKR